MQRRKKMVDSNYARAYTEILEIISHFPPEEYNKIPSEKIDFFKDNMDKEYVFKIDPNTDLGKQNISKEARATLIALFKDYYATDRQKGIINRILMNNELKADEEKRKKYNPDDIFSNRKKDIDNDEEKKITLEENKALTERKDSFFERFKIFIRKLLHMD